MVDKSYDWDGGAILEDHTKKKHKILSEYFSEYLRVRCRHPQQSKFRLAIVDGFSGAGKYKEGEYGSPLIFIDTLSCLIKEINCYRTSQGHKSVSIECLIIFNDSCPIAIQKLKENTSPLLAALKNSENNLQIHCEYLNNEFDKSYSYIKKRVLSTRCNNVFFNLDQCGYSHVTSAIIRDITSTWKSAEILLTFMIKSILTYLSPDGTKNNVILEPDVKEKIDLILKHQVLNKKEWLGEAEKITFNYLKACAKYVSPFSINNPNGWKYWLMHYATSHRARQVYNDILHKYGEAQAHYGRSGLNMLSYDPDYGKAGLYLFNEDSRQVAKDELMEDIPRLISQAGDVMTVGQFYENAYSETPAHSEDINQAILSNPELEVTTASGGNRRKANTIRVEDTIRLTSQKSFYFI